MPKADAVPSVVFGSTTTLDNPAGTNNTSSIDPSIAVSGNLVWIVWAENTGGTTKIMMRNSTDSGATFGTVTDLTLNSPTTPPICTSRFNDYDCRGFPQVYANGTNAYVVWQDSSTYAGGGINSANLGDAFYRKISYSDSTFTITPPLTSAPLIINPTPGTGYVLAPVIAVSSTGGYVHVVWAGTGATSTDDHLYHRRSTDSGVTFTATTTNLSPGIGVDSYVFNPDIAIDGSNVYVVWEDRLGTGPTADILFTASSDNGNIFNGGSSGTAGNPKDLVTGNLASPDATDSLHPQISAVNGKTYVVWDDASGSTVEIFYRNSTNVGATFGPAITSPATVLSTSGGNNEVEPQIGANSDGSKVFVTWAENGSNDIKFKRSTDSGVTFAAVQTIDSAGTDNSPKLDSLGNNVYIVWQDTSVGGAGDIFFTSSSDGGATFANKQNLSNDGTLSKSSQLDSGSSHVVWVDDPSGNDNILTTSGVFGLDLSWNQTNYKTGDTANITLLTGSGSGTLSVTVKSSADNTGFAKTLTETSPGTYTGSITFSETSTNSGSSILKVAAGGTITVTKDSTSTNANIYPRTVSWDAHPYTKGDGSVGGTAVRFTVTDQNSNTNSLTQENISVTISSASTGNSVTITAQETGVNTGLFKNDNLIFSTGISTATVGSTATISQIGINSAGYASNGIIDTINVNVKSTTFPAGFNLVLTETSINSNNFQGTLNLSSTGPSSGTTIQVAAGDIVSLTYNSATENVLIDPTANPNTRIRALSSAIGDTVTVTWGTATDTVSITNDGAGGGGGGGVSRAGLVVQAVGAIALFGGGSSGTSGPPSFDSAVFSLETDGVKVSPESMSASTSSFTVGKKSDISMGFKMPGGLNDLDHIGLYANIGPGQDKYDTDTYIYFDRFKTPQITIHDPHGFFKSVNIDVIEPTKSNIDVNFVFDFAKSIDNPNVVFEAWNIKKDGAIKEIPDLLKVDDPTKPEDVVPKDETITQTTEERPPVPDWVKSNAAWWGKGTIDDNEFTNGIGYLIQKQIIDVPGLLEKNTSPEKIKNPDTGVMEEPEEFVPIVPAWVKNNALWWSEGQLTDDDFLVGIKYLLEKGIIQVRV